MGLTGMDEVFIERRKHTCSFHESNSDKIEGLEHQMEGVNTRMSSMSKTLNIGVGLMFAAGIIITLILWNVSTYRADIEGDLHRHEEVITYEQEYTREQLEDTVRTVNVMSGEIKSISSTLDTYRRESREDLDDIKNYLRYGYMDSKAGIP